MDQSHLYNLDRQECTHRLLLSTTYVLARIHRSIHRKHQQQQHQQQQPICLLQHICSKERFAGMDYEEIFVVVIVVLVMKD